MKKTFFKLGVLASILALIFVLTSADPRPAGPEPMSGLTAMQYFRNNNIKAGINLGATLEAVNHDTSVSVETIWGNIPANQAHFNGIKRLGFDIVRIPVTWMGHIGPAPNYTVEEAWLNRVTEVAGYAKNSGLKAIINIHHDGSHEHGGWLFDAMSSNSAKRAEVADKYEKVWRQIAAYFINYGDWLMFEGFNELNDGSWDHGNGPGAAQKSAIINDLNRRFTNAVRGTGGNNSGRYLIYNGYMTSHTIAEPYFNLFVLPADGANGNTKQIVSFHYYEPLGFGMKTTTHQWGTDNDKAVIDQIFGNFKTKFVDNNIPVIIGENGPNRYANWRLGSGNPGYNAANVPAARANRLAYVDYLNSSARKNGLVPHVWENGSWEAEYSIEGDPVLINRATGQPNSTESAEVIRHIIAAVNSAAILPVGQATRGNIPIPNHIAGNMGQYFFGTDNNTTFYQQAYWLFGPLNLQELKNARSLVLVLNSAPTATVSLAWQDGTTWSWNETEILTGGVRNLKAGTTWNARTRTLTINLRTALANNSNLQAENNSVKLFINYYNGDGGTVNDLGIVSANIVAGN